ncbi:MAG: DUF6624 domain-containing protein [Leadbetterella sp.]
MIKITTTTFLFMIANSLHSQELLNEYAYFKTKWVADSLYKVGEYFKAEKIYTLAKKQTNHLAFHQTIYKKTIPLYLKIGKLKKCKKHLHLLLNSGYIVYEWKRLLSDTLWLNKKEWQNIKDKNARNQYNTESGNSKSLKKTLSEAYIRDQRIRKPHILDSLKQIYPDSIAQKILTDSSNSIDSYNIQILKKVISENGWPTIQQVGSDGISNCWILIQHADLDVEFQKTVLPLIEEAVLKGEGHLLHYAYLMDRVLVNTRQDQIFGTQFGDPILDENRRVIDVLPKPLKDEKNLDILRNAFELNTFQEYKKLFFERFYGSNKQ